MAKKLLALVLTLSFLGLLAAAPDADAKRRGGSCPIGVEDPLCHPED